MTAPSTVGGSGRRPAHSSFVRRCWYKDRGCAESSTCSEVRELFDKRKVVKRVPPPEECEHPTYVVTGSRYRHGFMEDNRLETLEFPGEAWHKCCVVGTDSAHKRLVCQKAGVVKHSQLLNQHKGFCGAHYCTGTRDRCLIVDKLVDKNFKTQRRGFCPKGCWRACQRTSYRMECIHVGDEPAAGAEGSEVPLREFAEPEKYTVFSLSMPEPAWLAMAQPIAGDAACADRRRLWDGFLVAATA